MVSENTPPWLDRAFGLLLSIRRFGGTHAHAPVVIHVVGGADRASRLRLEELGARVRPVERVDPRYPYANKLRMFEAGPDEGTDVLVGLDCDTVVLGDVSPFLTPSAVGAKPVDGDFLGEREWRRIFREVGIRPPARTCRTTTLNQLTYPYFNSGVLVVPRSSCPALAVAWGDLIRSLAPAHDLGPRPAARDLYTDQVALALALISTSLPVRPLPVAMNFPAHLSVHPAHLATALPPRILHYHSRVDPEGFLLATKYREANQLIERFNRERADALGVSYGALRGRGAAAAVMQELRSRPSYYWPPVRTLRTGLASLVRRR